MMALGIHYLTGYSAAADLASEQPEWPPHPARVFMAMAAAHFESGSNAAERSALEWLESIQEPPAIYAGKSFPRELVDTFVPVNDTCKGVFDRPRQARRFYRARLADDTAYVVWSADPPSALLSPLDALCHKVTRIGHSSSLVRMWLAQDGAVPDCNYRPGEVGRMERFRIPVRGTLQDLEAAFNQVAREEYDKAEAAISIAHGAQKKTLRTALAARFPDGPPERRRPLISRWHGYVQVAESYEQPPIMQGPFEPDFVILTKQEGNALGLASTLQLTGALRNAAMKAASDNPPEWLSGHRQDGTPSTAPHVAFFPLPYIGYEHADGHIMGLGLAIPRTVGSDPALRRVFGRLLFREDGDPAEISLWAKKSSNAQTMWRWSLQRETRETPPASLQRRRWTGPAVQWATVTPIVLHHYPKKSRTRDVERILYEAFESALLPAPAHIRVQNVSALPGAGHVRDLPAYEEGGNGLCRYQVHVVVRFAGHVEGPVLVGRGRFRGYGLLAPFSEERA